MRWLGVLVVVASALGCVPGVVLIEGLGGESLCPGGTASGRLEIGAVADLERLQGCRRVDGDLLLTGGFSDLSVLDQLEEVTGTFAIETSGLEIIELPALTTVGQIGLNTDTPGPLRVVSFPALTTAKGIQMGTDNTGGVENLERLSFPLLEEIEDEAEFQERISLVISGALTELDLSSLRRANAVQLNFTPSATLSEVSLPALEYGAVAIGPARFDEGGQGRLDIARNVIDGFSMEGGVFDTVEALADDGVIEPEARLPNPTSVQLPSLAEGKIALVFVPVDELNASALRVARELVFAEAPLTEVALATTHVSRIFATGDALEAIRLPDLNTASEALLLRRARSLATLELGGLTALTNFFADEVGLTEIDLSAAPIDVGGGFTARQMSALTRIDLSGTHSLQGLSLSSSPVLAELIIEDDLAVENSLQANEVPALDLCGLVEVAERMCAIDPDAASIDLVGTCDGGSVDTGAGAGPDACAALGASGYASCAAGPAECTAAASRCEELDGNPVCLGGLEGNTCLADGDCQDPELACAGYPRNVTDERICLRAELLRAETLECGVTVSPDSGSVTVLGCEAGLDCVSGLCEPGGANDPDGNTLNNPADVDFPGAFTADLDIDDEDCFRFSNSPSSPDVAVVLAESGTCPPATSITLYDETGAAVAGGADCTLSVDGLNPSQLRVCVSTVNAPASVSLVVGPAACGGPSNCDLDQDQDGIGRTLEASLGTDDTLADTDGDGICDGRAPPVGATCTGGEDANLNGVVDSGETNPAAGDTDCDGVRDGDESNLGTNPLDSDTDRDGLLDGLEAGNPTLFGAQCEPVVADASLDTDTLNTTNPNNPDSDGDGLCDGNLSVDTVCTAGEDLNQNGAVDNGETDPNVAN